MEIKLEEVEQLKPVTITFTPKEFEMLRAIFGAIYGAPRHPLRHMASAIYSFGEDNGYKKFTDQSCVPFVSNWHLEIPVNHGPET